MPTGCRSEYLVYPLAHVVLVSCRPRRPRRSRGTRETLGLSVPARDLEGGAENLCSHEFRHDEGFSWLFGGGRWEGERSG
jgi:hypothetical protein